MNQVPHITVDLLNEALNAAKPQADGKYSIVDVFNAAQKLAEANAEQEQYITAEEARKLGPGKAEFFSSYRNKWVVCSDLCQYLTKSFDYGEEVTFKYRAIKQPVPVEPTCQVRNLNTGELKTMTREAAKQLWDELGYTVEWFSGVKQTRFPADQILSFDDTKDGCPNGEPAIYTYKSKANLVKLDGELMTREAAIAKYEAVKDKCELESRSNFEHCQIFKKEDAPHWFAFDFNGAEYRLVAKPLKQVSWKDVPVGVAVQTVNKKLICTFVGMAANGLISIYNRKSGADDYRAEKFELAPASEQPWIAVQAGETGDCIMVYLSEHGFEVDTHVSLQKYRITGLAEGYELK